MKIKKILITGGAGYIGSVLTKILLEQNHRVLVLDRCFFGLEPIKEYLNNKNFQLIQDDIRYVAKGIFKHINTVIHLAALSNDPACEIDPRATKSINYQGTVRLAKLSREMGVKRFIFSSSCSVYGQGSSLELTEKSALNPVSLYAQTKVKAEKEILKLANKNFLVAILRNATVYGLSKRMRFDLAVNIMTLHAFKNKKIYILGGGTQWRPNVHIQDVANAFISVMEAPAKKIQKQIFNVGSNEQNYQIYQIAQMIKKIMPETIIEKVVSDPDKRNYNVNFDKIHKVLNYRTEKKVTDGILEIKNGLEAGILTDAPQTRTLDYYKYLLEASQVLKEVSLKGKIF